VLLGGRDKRPLRRTLVNSASLIKKEAREGESTGHLGHMVRSVWKIVDWLVDRHSRIWALVDTAHDNQSPGGIADSYVFHFCLQIPISVQHLLIKKEFAKAYCALLNAIRSARVVWIPASCIRVQGNWYIAIAQ